MECLETSRSPPHHHSPLRNNRILITQETEEELEEGIMSARKNSEMDKEEKEKEPSNRFIILLKLTGLYFGNRNPENFWYYKENFWYYAGMVRAFIMCGLATYQSIVMVYLLFLKRPNNEKTAFTIFVISYNIQSTMAVVFLVYWQLRGHLNRLLDTISWPTEDEPHIHRSIKIVLGLCITFMTCIFLYASFTAYMLFMGHHEYILVDAPFLEAFGKDQYRFLGLFVTYMAGNTWLIVLIFYIIVSVILYGRFKEFNEELDKVGLCDDESWPIQEQLLEGYNEHIRMARMVRTVDHMFEVYIFAMIGLNIPTTIFGIISCFSVAAKNLFLVMPAPFLCSLQLLGLTAVPARVHTAIREVRNILYGNTRIWRPYSEQIYQIASVFISHVEQANLGYSVWGFAVVTKPLILTTVSITITYLTILIQLKENHEQNIYGQVCPCNITTLHH